MPTASTSCHPMPTTAGTSTTSEAVPLSTHLENVGDIPTIVPVDPGGADVSRSSSSLISARNNDGETPLNSSSGAQSTNSSSQNYDCSLYGQNELVDSLNSNIVVENSLHLDVNSPNDDCIPTVSNNVEIVTKCGGATSTNEAGSSRVTAPTISNTHSMVNDNRSEDNRESTQTCNQHLLVEWHRVFI
ncbi:hypothetical protein V6N12_009606 [Hibiscus sabdariffa]|uniref:Uncharacterized protein n=1 Tax=Hibiscus sabdariffa TaxID=183260 RepID=A0ABR1ZW07_9ROSI